MTRLNRFAMMGWLIVMLTGTTSTSRYAHAAPMESLAPTNSVLQSITRGDGAWVQGQGIANVSEYDMDFTALPGLNLRQSYRQSIVKHKDALLNTGVDESTTNLLSLELMPRTNFAFTREIKTLKDLQQALLAGTRTRTLGLTQGFGTGHSTGTLQWQRIETTKYGPDKDPEDLLTRILALDTGVGEGYNLSAKLTNTDTPEVIGLHSRKTEAALALPFSGGPGKIAFSKFTENKDIHRKVVRITDIEAPLALFGGKAAVVYLRNSTVKDGEETKEHTFKFDTPLESIRSGATFSYSSEPVKRKDKPTQQVRNATLFTPLGFLGTTGELKLARGSISEPGRVERPRSAYLMALVQGKPLSVQTTTRHIDSGGTRQTIRDFILDTPELSLLNDQTKLEYHLHMTNNNGEKSQVPRIAFSTVLGFLDDAALLTHNIEQVERKKKPTQEVRSTDFQMPLSLFGSGVKFEQRRITLREPDKREVQYRSYVAAAMSNEKELTLEYKVNRAENGSGERLFKRPYMAFSMPLDFLRNNATFTHRTEQVERKNKPLQEARTTELKVPFNVFGSAANLEQKRLTTREPGSQQIHYRTYLAVAMSGEKLELERRATNTPTADGINRERRFSIQTPKLQLFTDWAGVKGNHVVTEYTGRSSVRTTELDLNAQPLKALALTGKYSIRDEGPGKDSRYRKIYSALKLSKSLALNGYLEQSNATDNRATVLRNIYLTKKKNGDHGLDIQVGYTTWGGSSKDWDPAGRVQLAWGNPKNLGINVQYTEYDDKKWQRLDKALTVLQLLHGDPDSLNIKLEYQNQPQQSSQNRQVHLALPVLGGNMQLGYVQNPLDRLGKNPLAGRKYDLAFSRGIFGGVKMDLSYAYSNLTQKVNDQQVLQYLQFHLTGGKEEGGGKIDFNYQSGDFVPQPDPKKAVPLSLLDLSYARSWGDNGRLEVSVHRVTPPTNAGDIKRSCGGRLEYSATF